MLLLLAFFCLRKGKQPKRATRKMRSPRSDTEHVRIDMPPKKAVAEESFLTHASSDSESFPARAARGGEPRQVL